MMSARHPTAGDNVNDRAKAFKRSPMSHRHDGRAGEPQTLWVSVACERQHQCHLRRTAQACRAAREDLIDDGSLLPTPLRSTAGSSSRTSPDADSRRRL